MINEETEYLIDAIGLAQKKLIDIAVQNQREIFGHSFSDDGKLQWQFIIEKVFGDKCLIRLYSWLTGLPDSEKVVDVEFIKTKCAIYLTEKEWTDSAELLQRKQ